jgi:predicted DNA-binding transcriptional regulator AlpA
MARRSSAANDATEQPETHLETTPSDLIGMNDILREFGLKRSQVIKLREKWDFPPPALTRGKLLFSRTSIESWAQSQPNMDNLAIVLRRRKRRHRMCT